MSMLTVMEPTVIAPRCRRREERGSSLVEFALVVTLLSTLLLGIIVFGILLSKRQVLTQATAEGARAAVPYQYTASNTANVKNAARSQVNKSLSDLNRVCDDVSTTCSFDVFPCSGAVGDAATGTGDCLRVSVAVDILGSQPLVPNVSLITAFLPSRMSSTFTSTLANPT